jgi:hypothetical protein
MTTSSRQLLQNPSLRLAEQVAEARLRRAGVTLWPTLVPAAQWNSKQNVSSPTTKQLSRLQVPAPCKRIDGGTNSTRCSARPPPCPTCTQNAAANFGRGVFDQARPEQASTSSVPAHGALQESANLLIFEPSDALINKFTGQLQNFRKIGDRGDSYCFRVKRDLQTAEH